MPMETDRALLNAARQMDKDSLVKIFDLYSSALYHYALRLCGDRMLSDQIVGDVFARLLDQISIGKGPTANLRSYLYEATYHKIIDETRYSRRRAPLEVADWLHRDREPSHLRLEQQVLFEQIVQVIQEQLNADQRHVLILRFLEGFSLRETATIMGKKEEHVKVIQSRAIARLRGVLDYKGIRQAVPFMRLRSVSGTVGG